ncbi:MAG: electron transfer flavoprotein subunit alpha [Thermodesulfobacteriota bacterium]|nr:MAG: electron transfer flavoprotein subunit alpha [Thermodesulfobacteriota bacterium]
MPKNSKGIEVAKILPEKCIGCQICVAECPVGAIEMSNGAAVIDPEVCIGCGKCFEVCPVEAVKFEKKRSPKKIRKPEEVAQYARDNYRGVAVFIESFNGQGATVSWELIGKARQLAEKLNTRVIGFLLGYEVNDSAREAIAYGCDEVHVIDDPLLRTYISKPYGKALTDLCKKVKPEIFLIGATPLGRDLAGIVATNLETGLTADCTGLDIEEEKNLLLMTRPTFGGNIMATIFCEHHRPQMSTVRPRVFKTPEKNPARNGNIYCHVLEPPHDKLPELIDFIKDVVSGDGVDISRFPALVVAGKGACDLETMPLLEELANLVGGIVACSRPVVEAGLMPYDRQVGQTGKTVAPKLYLGIGVSGAVQHLVGMQGSEKIIAVNADPKAPIFNVADVGIIGDYKKVVPVLIEELKKRKLRN